MRGTLSLLAPIAAVATLCGLSIALAPAIGPVGGKRPAPDPRFDGKWENRLEEAIDPRFMPKSIGAKHAEAWPPEDGEEPQVIAAADSAAVPFPQDPFLRIETEQHSAGVQSVSVDADGRFLVTSSYDKTARLWSIPQSEGEGFQLLKIFRPPIGEGEEGKLYTAVITPDGDTVAACGWTGYDWDRAVSVYVFERATGALLRRLGGLPDVCQSLEVSPDGKFLAVGLSGGRGIRIFETAGWSEVPTEAADYRDAVYGLSFAADGRLVTGSDDGFVRLYSSDFRLKARSQPLGNQPVGDVAFSPKGELAAAAGETATIVILRDDLSEIRRLDTADLHNDRFASLHAITWADGGDTLYAGGRAMMWGEDRILVRRFKQAGSSAFEDISVSSSTLMGLTSRKDRVFFGTKEPAFGIIEGTSIVASLDTTMMDFRGTPFQAYNNIGALRVSNDGASISLPFHYKSKQYWQFNAASRRLDVTDAEATEFNPPRLIAPGVDVVGWKETRSPGLNGKPLPLEYGEMSRSLAIAPSNDRFLLGTEWLLRLFDLKGKVLWRVVAPGPAWKVNISEDGKLAIAAYGDGTVHWYDMRNGKELLALFLTNEPKPRWIAWTPSGYYDASPGAEDLIGWHINQGRNKEALFFPVGRFRDLYYRPDIIKTVLEMRDVKAPPSRQALLKKAPPIVTVLGYREAENGEVTVEYEVRTIFGDPVKDVEVYVNDAPYDTSGSRNFTTISGPQSVTVKGNGCAPDVGIVVVSEKGRRSEPALARAMRVSPADCKPKNQRKPNLYAVVVGISQYLHEDIRDLSFADDDARDFVTMLKLQEGGIYETATIRPLVDEQATDDAILAQLNWLMDALNPDGKDIGVVFIASHGVRGKDGKYYFLAHNSDPSDLQNTAVWASDAQTRIADVDGLKVVFLDACYSTSMADGALQLFDTKLFTNELGERPGAIVFASSGGDEVSYEDKAWQNGAFTYALIEGAAGAADAFDKDRRITASELQSWLEYRVPQLIADAHKAGTQNPIMVAQVRQKIALTSVHAPPP